MSDRRKEPRKKLTTFIPVYQSGSGTILGYLGNLTLQGAMLVSESPLEIGKQLTLLIEFPGETAQRMTIPARVVRCVPEESPRNLMIGCEFSEVTPAHAELIQFLLDRYHFRYQTD
jgi:Tfp pilus assembly protein PilZ